jgi:hypothetical protein
MESFLKGANPTMQVKLPNFLIVGAPKSGTTSLYHYLRQHPDVFMPEKKELWFFIASICRNINPEDPRYEFYRKNTVFTFENYTRLFEPVKNEKAIGEASPLYLCCYEIAIPQIKKFLGDVRIIVILRNPVARAFSHHTHSLRDRLEVLSFEKCLELEEERRAAHWATAHYYKEVGLYYRQVKAYIENFGRVKVALYDDLVEDALGLTQGIYEFLEVDRSFVPDVKTKYQMTGVPKSRFLYEFIDVFRDMSNPIVRVMLPKGKRLWWYKYMKTLKVKTLVKPEMKPETREYLKNIFREDVLKLQDLLNRDLSHWLS